MFFRKQHTRQPELVWKSLPDEELISIYKTTHDLKYITELFERYTHLIYVVCMKYLKNEESCKDAVMSIFEELIKKVKKHDITNFKNWVYSLTKNHCLMKLRRKQQFNRFAAHEVQQQKSMFVESMARLHPIDKPNYAEKTDVLNKAIKQLNKEQALCIRLFYLEEKSYKEVASTTGFSIKQVKSYIQNGKRNLKLYLENNG